MDIQALKATCRQVRRDIVTMCTGAGSGHPGGSLSCTEALVALYFDVMKVDPKNPKDPARDRFVLSKGHAAPALYGVLAAKGFFDRKEFEHFRQLHSILQGHPDAKKCPGVDASTGSLGQGISIATGMALGAKHTGNPCHVYTIIGDGESQEGQIWEGAMMAGTRGLDHLIAFTDYNKMQIDGYTGDVNTLDPLDKRWESFGWNVQVVDGHDIGQILSAVDTAKKQKGHPSMIILNTIKGKGLYFAENKLECHNMNISEEMWKKAVAQLEEEEM